jgi:small-conductance mechanosensitive channel
MDKTQNEGMNQPPNEVRAAADTEEYRRAEGVKHWNQLLEKNKRIEELEAENKAVKEEWAAHIEYHKTVVAKRNELEAEAARLKEEIALFFRTNVQAPRTAFERLAKAASKPYNSQPMVQSSVQSPEDKLTPEQEENISNWLNKEFLKQMGLNPDEEARTGKQIMDDIHKRANERLKSPSLVNDEWISVKERLPEKDERILVWYLHKLTGVGYAVCDFLRVNPGSGVKYWGAHHSERVTHWMPLPPAPKSEASKEEL